MNQELEIGASLRRRQCASEQQQEPGESAWDLPTAHPPRAQLKANAPAESGPSPNGSHNSGHADSQRQLSSAEWPREARKESGGEHGSDSNSNGEPPMLPPFPDFDDEEDAKPAGPGFDFMRFARGLWRRKWLVISITLASTMLFLMIALSMPREWRATTTLITGSSQAAFQVSAARPFEPQNYDLQTFVDTIKLPSSLDETMQRTGISVMRRTLASAIAVWFDDDSKVFSIHVTWDEPKMAARIANIVTELFLENSARIRLGNTKERFDEYNAQLREAREDFQRINDALIAYAETNQIASLENQISALVRLITDTEANYNANIAKVEALRAAKRRIDEQYEAEPEMIVTSSRYRSPFKQRLSDYQWELQEARTRYTEQNPKIIRLKGRIETLEQLITESGDEVAPENVYEINPKRGELFLRKQQTDDQLEIAEAEANAQRETLDESRTRLSRLLAARAGWEELNSQSKDSARLVDSLAARLSEVRVAMQQVNSGFSILEDATPPDLPEPSLRKLVAAAGIILGSAAALFVALLLELLDPLIRTARDAQNITRCRLILEFEEAPQSNDARIEPDAPTAPVATLFRRIANDLKTALEPREWKQLAITSAEPHAGRSLVASNLAAALGLQEQEAWVIDADLRVTAGPRPTTLLNALPSADAHSNGKAAAQEALGLTEVLSGRCRLDQALLATTRRGVKVLGSGSMAEETLEDDDYDLLKLGSQAFAELNQELEQMPLPVFYDLPPITETESVAEAVARVEQCLLVVRCNQTRRTDLKRATNRLTSRGIQIRAVVVTMVPELLLTTPSVFRSRYSGTWLDRLLVSRLAEF